MLDRRFSPARLLSELLRLPLLTLTVAAGALLVQALPGWIDLLEYRRAAIGGGELYRLLGGHLTHWSWKHLGYDLAAFLILGIALERRSRLRWVLCVVGTALASSSLLWVLRPQIASYRGLSAIDSALFAAFAVELAAEAWHSGRTGAAPGYRLAALAFPGLLVAKMLYEAVTGTALFAHVGGITVLPELHLLGALVGAVVLGLSSGSSAPSSIGPSPEVLGPGGKTSCEKNRGSDGLGSPVTKKTTALTESELLFPKKHRL